MGPQQAARSERRRRLARREREIAELARQQHSVLSRRQLLDAGLSGRTIRRRVQAGRLWPLHRGVFAFGDGNVSRRGRWLAAVLACGDGALLSHRSAAALWGLMRSGRGPVEVSAAAGRIRRGISVHQGAIFDEDRAVRDRIPVTSVARTLFDLAEVVDEQRLTRAFEEAERLRLLRLAELGAVCARGEGRHALRPVREVVDALRVAQDTQSPLEDMVLELCRQYDLPAPVTGATVLGREVDALWPDRKVIVEADSWKFHSNREAFERDRARDAGMQVEGYHVMRLTHLRMRCEPDTIAAELRALLDPGARRAAS